MKEAKKCPTQFQYCECHKIKVLIPYQMFWDTKERRKIDNKYECIRKVYQKDQKYTNHNNGICDGSFHEYLNGSTDFIMSPFDKEFPLSTCGIHFWVSNSIFECFTSYLL